MALNQTKKFIFLILGWVTLILAIIGIPLPLLPTTPFALLSAYFFSKGSERMHEWLIHSPVLGVMIQDWNNHGVIRLKAKVISTILIVALFSYTLVYVDVNKLIKSIVATTGVVILSFILSRPSVKKERL